MWGKTVLIIDDDPTNVQMLSDYLEKFKFVAVAAYDAYSATVQAARSAPDLIILDYAMPAGNGSLVYGRLRRISQTANVPVIFISGRGIEALQKSVPPQPNIRYLSKPVDFNALQLYLRELLPDFADYSVAPTDKPLDRGF